MPGSHGVCVYDIMQFFFNQVNKIGLRDRASAIAFNLIMAIPAAAIFLFTLIPYFPIAKNMQDVLFNFIEDVLPNTESRSLIITTMLRTTKDAVPVAAVPDHLAALNEMRDSLDITVEPAHKAVAPMAVGTAALALVAGLAGSLVIRRKRPWK